MDGPHHAVDLNHQQSALFISRLPSCILLLLSALLPELQLLFQQGNLTALNDTLDDGPTHVAVWPRDLKQQQLKKTMFVLTKRKCRQNADVTWWPLSR